MSSNSGSDSSSGENPEDSWPLDLEEILGGPKALEDFFQDIWGRSTLSRRVTDDVLANIFEKFHDGNVEKVLGECRKEDNACYSSEEISTMESDLETGKKTLNLPFCFCEGAVELKESFLRHGRGRANDVEVGVYFSRVGGDVATWHFDNNHNITIQVQGQKDWYHIAGDPNTVGNRGMQDPAKNWHEQLCTVPPTGPDSYTCHNLGPGSIIYLPPGHWHSVVPVQDDSFSVDIRIANLPHSKWIAEAIFAGLLASFYRQPQPGPQEPFRGKLLAVGPADLEGRPSADVADQVAHVAANLPAMMEACRIPRCFPAEARHSDGLERGASLEFLIRAGFAVPPPELGGRGLVGAVAVNSLVSLTVHQRNSDTVLRLFSESSLTEIEYMRFRLHCPGGLFAPLRQLALRGRMTVDDLYALAPEYTNKCEVLLRVLVYANVLWEPGSETARAERAITGLRSEVDGGPAPSGQTKRGSARGADPSQSPSASVRARDRSSKRRKQ